MTALSYSAAPAMPRLRLTRRGRAVLTTLAAVPFVLAAMLIGLNGGGAVATSTTPDATFEWVTIDAGESLWGLAAEIAPEEDPREFAAQVVSLNQLASSDVRAGQRLAIPAQYAD
jgi:hypothetical protein